MPFRHPPVAQVDTAMVAILPKNGCLSDAAFIAALFAVLSQSYLKMDAFPTKCGRNFMFK